MNVRELREILDQCDDETEVRLMTQPSWPFEYSISGVWEFEPVEDTRADLGYGEDEDLPEDDGFDPAETDEQVLYLLEGSQLGYGTKRAWDG